jgi:hypothetical protein
MSNKLNPENRYFVDDYAKKYEELALLYNTPESIDVSKAQ